ncbi:hypothetical protein BD413DRAFT_81993 [Trametes elegans]|nr:hypothetical protein BD413DRAFT_81993 [Trametes elegans]
MVLGKLYVNSLLASLNVRASLNRTQDDTVSHSTLRFDITLGAGRDGPPSEPDTMDDGDSRRGVQMAEMSAGGKMFVTPHTTADK